MLIHLLLSLMIHGACSHAPWLRNQNPSRLPGADDLQSGYDAAKMLSASDQNSKFQIFDLSEENPTAFKISILDKERVYTTPLLTQVTAISRRREISCQSISYSFDHFYSSYFQSISFGFGVELPGMFSFGVQYSETLKRVHEGITKRSQAVGTSTIWWGLYSIQLGPPFLLKLHPMFTMSVSYLATHASKPLTEVHQLLYNQFIETYGTHYVSRVIVGGMANLYTFINKEYYQQTSYTETSQQIGLLFSYKSLEFTPGFQWEQALNNINGEFQHNSDAITEFRPPVATIVNQSEWHAWTNNAGEQPVVINRTLSHLANLISEHPQVAEHLRRTIDFYLTRGFLPTLAQMQLGVRAVPYLRSSIVTPINGLDVVGCGYDPLMLESRFCILDNINTSENEQWVDPYNQTVVYSIPNGYFAINTPESLTIDASAMVTSVEDYFQQKTTVTVRSQRTGFLGLIKKRIQTTIVDFYRRFYQDYYSMTMRLKQIGWYTLAVSTFPYPKFNSIAEKAFSRLPTTFDPHSIHIWKEFFAIYGTHIVVAANMGGLVWAETWYEKCLTYEHTEQWINKQIANSFLFIPTGGSNEEEHEIDVDKKFTEHSIISSELLGGSEAFDPANWTEWTKTVKYNPRPISYRLVQLDELLPQGDRRTALRTAIEYFLNEAIDEDQTYIAKLENSRGPPRTTCSRNSLVHREEKSPEIEDNVSAARLALCPYVGYTGLTCVDTKDASKVTSTSNYKKLPVGVGMTLDIITGNLLLPAIEYTYPNTTSWIDPFNNQTYWSPQEVSVLPPNASENVPVARIFLNPNELINQWKYERLQGTWLGGEFGHSQTVLNIYNKFFSNKQAVSITQHPTELYRVRLERPSFNQPARKAIDALTHTYNEVLYTDFINAWGTHIVTEAVIGGMHEQQVLFKDCVFSFNGAITLANLDEYLKKDILYETLGNSFYAERRKISVDHYLGGNPAISNKTLWLHSLPDNPAMLKIQSYTPWYDLITDKIVKKNLQKIIDNLTAISETQRLADTAKLTDQRVNGRYLALQASIGVLNNGLCEITDKATLDPVLNCSTGCSTTVQLKSTTGFTSDRPLWYVRDPTTGFVRARVRLDASKLDLRARSTENRAFFEHDYGV